jgi:hypothetical protein
VSYQYKNPTKRVGLVQSGHHHHLCSRHDIAEKNADLALSNDHSLTP